MIDIILSTVLFVGFTWSWIVSVYVYFWAMGGLQDVKGPGRLLGPLVPSFVFFVLFQAVLMKGLF